MTFETFRDMGAAFAVALVLIYILVVWEFGNFRIPLVIMAPIPLTLLGIIPAHFIMFELGLGGEFTATSMIGWIALAGIIVRNSILLVDFSIHEIQKGIPVTEAVIRSCMTRTRPILITALALVAGSSVIFTDPIFQGMAISLASGVLVSTVLTLIVIPLGCVAASRDMCEVAAATAPPGVTVPCTMDEEEKVQKEEKAKGSGGGGLVKVLGNIVQVFVMIFYAIRGIFLLLFDVLKGLFKKKKRPVAKAPVKAPTTASPGSGPAPSSTPQTPTAPAGSANTGETGGVSGATETSAPPTPSAPAGPGGPTDTGETVDNAPGTASSDSDSGKAQTADDALTVGEPAKTSSQAAPEPQKSAEVQPADVAAPPPAPQQAAEPQGASSKGRVTKKAATKKAVVKKASGKKTAQKKSTAKKVAAKNAQSSARPSTQKKTSRRGIRLKVDDEQDSNFH